MTARILFPGEIVVRAGGVLDQSQGHQPDWGVYADESWNGWPGVLLDWPDFGLPADHAAVGSAIREGFARARRGQDVLIGCRGGTGRTGTILACLAVLAGVPADLAVQWVRDHYRSNAVETSAQADWLVNRFAQVDLVRREAARSRARFVKVAVERLRGAMWEALQQPERSPVLAWAVPDVLAITQRPLRTHPEFGGSGRSYQAAARPAIEEWLQRLNEQRIRSVLVLTSNKELAHYDAPTAFEGGLLAFYATRGLAVAHFPADDPAHDVRAKDAFEGAVEDIADRVAEGLARTPLPAVMHCSAAIDRSPPVAARIAFMAEVGRLSLDQTRPRR